MYTNGDPKRVEELPEPLKLFIKSSQLWRAEQLRGAVTTECMASLFPKDNKQDVSFTIWGGNDGAYDLNDYFNLQLEVSN